MPDIPRMNEKQKTQKGNNILFMIQFLCLMNVVFVPCIYMDSIYFYLYSNLNSTKKVH